jgi:hypothetical protein
LLVLLPGALSTGADLAKFLSIRAGGYSLIYQARTSNLGFSRAVTEVWLAGAGMQFAIFGIVLTGIFWISLLSGTCLPVALSEESTIPDVRRPAWEGCWLTLRFGSLLPATVGHWLSNVGIFSSHDPEYPGSEWAERWCGYWWRWRCSDAGRSSNQSGKNCGKLLRMPNRQTPDFRPGNLDRIMEYNEDGG